ncbi:histidine kinase/DNA gyrase B/HSP90-like ATPase [Dyadobacter jejuensis]|uniref:histidine kinase n=1 Tax=Dyadobacter jejuensis TaxID=1082580 RepID=A0A316A9P0_9BACT|nr:ATP-binding protein [Dyadobacter jejuensis]PWJ53584.1 histidine kinase/DNA gyrase B/HSP90-like ATPase [Dyadobacter jejuensis]
MKAFSTQIILRIALLLLASSTMPFLVMQGHYLATGLVAAALLMMGLSLYRYTTTVNRKLTLFFESVEYSDFTVKLNSDNQKGNSFAELNSRLNSVMEAFRQARAEKEANFHFLNTVLQHIDIGVICHDESGNIEIMNKAAIRLLGIHKLRRIADLSKTPKADLGVLLDQLPTPGRLMYESSDGRQLSVTLTKLEMQGRTIKILSFQNIRTELQANEVKAWQNLTKVLRHEIMNSIAPIVSLTGTMRNILNEDFGSKAGIEEPLQDLNLALSTIESRGTGIMSFVNAYRDFTALPKPVLKSVRIQSLLKTFQTINTSSPIDIVILNDFELVCDQGQIEMVLLNLINNACEAAKPKDPTPIEVKAYIQNNVRMIEVKDQGTGIAPEAIDKIFVPFFTTKKTGSGIGLSLSKQIMHLHGGDLQVTSQLGIGTSFGMLF